MVPPPHFLAEVAAVLARKEPKTARASLFDLQLLEWESVESPAIYATAVDLSIHLGRHQFDTLYHAAAMCTEGATLITADDPITTRLDIGALAHPFEGPVRCAATIDSPGALCQPTHIYRELEDQAPDMGSR